VGTLSTPALRQPTEPRGAARHTIPVIDRMMDLFDELERRPDGASISALTAALALPRTSVYRILNTLQAHGMVRRAGTGAYRLGPRLIRLAAQVKAGGAAVDLAAAAQPVLDELAARTGYSVKLSVLDAEGVLVLAVAQGRRDYALTVTRGQRVPVHAGAAGKLLLAHLDPQDLAAQLAGELPALTPRTVTDPRRLKAEAARIRRQGWSQDKGEGVPGVFAFAAPVRDPGGRVVAALSIPFLQGTAPGAMDALRADAIGAAAAVSKALGR
jgi:DNA-binding IclR family transcriptional regulator